LGLPAEGFVFCCFNNSYKLNPDIFDRWMRILRRVESSVLWLSQTHAAAVGNLKAEAARRHVDPARLIFAPRLPSLAAHLERLCAADLFLDTLPYNAHATAVDALWAGVPVLTCPGNSFPARVAASLVTALDLPELIAADGEHYEWLAVEFATSSTRLPGIRKRLLEKRAGSPLFDAVSFTRNLEAAFRQMVERYQANLAPSHLGIEARPAAVSGQD
jgi:predicted O-linked N-acetylglucosamine transferase (SPINDLY family)